MAEITNIIETTAIAKKATRKDLFIWTRDFLETFIGADNDIANQDMLEQAIEMCNRYVGQLEKPRKPKANEKAIAFAEECLQIMQDKAAIMTDPEDMLFSATEIADYYNMLHPVDPEDFDAKPVSVQKVSAAMRRLVAEEKVERVEDKRKVFYKVIED